MFPLRESFAYSFLSEQDTCEQTGVHTLCQSECDSSQRFIPCRCSFYAVLQIVILCGNIGAVHTTYKYINISMFMRSFLDRENVEKTSQLQQSWRRSQVLFGWEVFSTFFFFVFYFLSLLNCACYDYILRTWSLSDMELNVAEDS